MTNEKNQTVPNSDRLKAAVESVQKAIDNRPVQVTLDDDDQPQTNSVAVERHDDGNDEPGIDQATMNRALDLGLDESEINEMEPDELARTLGYLERVVGRIDRSGQRRQVDAPQDAGAGKRADTRYKVALRKHAERLDEEITHPVVEEFERLNEHYAQVIDQYAERLERLETTLKSTEQDRRQNRFDSWLTGLGDSARPLFATGSTSSLHPRSQAAQNRAMIDEEAEIIRRGYESLGKRPPSLDECWSRSLRAIFPDHVQEVAEKQANADISRQRQKSTARPAKRSDRKPENGREKAIEEVARLMRNRR